MLFGEKIRLHNVCSMSPFLLKQTKICVYTSVICTQVDSNFCIGGTYELLTGFVWKLKLSKKTHFCFFGLKFRFHTFWGWFQKDLRLWEVEDFRNQPMVQPLYIFIEMVRKGCMHYCYWIISRVEGMVGREVGDNLSFTHFSIVYILCKQLIVHRFLSSVEKMSSEKGLVNLMYYEIINNKCCVKLFELTRKNVYGG